MGVAMVLFLRIDLCNYIWRIEKKVLFVDEIKIGVQLGTVKAIWNRLAFWHMEYLGLTDPGYTQSHKS